MSSIKYCLRYTYITIKYCLRRILLFVRYMHRIALRFVWYRLSLWWFNICSFIKEVRAVISDIKELNDDMS